MKCVVYTGDRSNHMPAKVVCANFNTNILTSHTVKFGFWVKNPATVKGLAIPLQVYGYDPYLHKKDPWNLIESAIQVIPTLTSAIADVGNFQVSNNYREIQNIDFSFTARNTKNLIQGNLYILKFNFDLRREQKYAGKFKYNSGFSDSSDIIFMRNCKTIILRVGATALTSIVSGGTVLNVLLDDVFYNPQNKLSQTE